VWVVCSRGALGGDNAGAGGAVVTGDARFRHDMAGPWAVRSLRAVVAYGKPRAVGVRTLRARQRPRTPHGAVIADGAEPAHTDVGVATRAAPGAVRAATLGISKLVNHIIILVKYII
jgi:hypothetical protein